MAEKNGAEKKSQRKAPPTLSDRYLKMALERRKLKDRIGSIDKAMKLIEDDSEAGKVHADQVELPISEDDDSEARA